MAGRLIVISKNTSFKGTLTAEEVVVEGIVEGDIRASEKVFVKSEAIIKGSIRTEKLFFEEGGKHNGTIQLGKKTTAETLEKALSKSDETEELTDEKQESSAEKVEQNESTKRLW